ncbi:Vegetative incompatibility protein HET-E-1 [Fulvia fulva]|uniref:Vegetative incompatibility protein HET-E-1 n=1 Tax=Passalora fulva TaxID=5499 RepID=A0A9Q8PLV9_PASFU|nr:Vegetative incompatibility protein HET-E-1 [Fulvia fulva]KAK4609458.1 Vegetative incompatibility protein HET-E-1 [Fulvia fulva]KAK4609755.1 Vegetative incompatibility protein HET-E-1 [Fulvia fulva]UJO24930.1 Vegetative incompatibility protein HET-E-1 [Fulvia fulva]WPV22496.1 Vegetative incompatibility protein HET-E-1 [Fulvia fulva]WPV37902.1 Vegetative incompatibility protein HET-E-1 [Fulvia fulva]
MRLINIHTLEFKEFFGRTRPGYAILSHRWGEREISYQDWLQYNGYHSRDSSSDTFVSRGPGYLKIIGFCRLIREATILWRPLNPDDNLKLIEWVWVDTCCIGKKSSAELSEAINSMYAWYRNAAICFVHLFDYSHMGEADMVESLGRCEWLSRGWTLQELLAPHYVCFYDVWWELFGVIRKFGFGGLMMEDYLGRLRRAPVNLYQNVSQITGISQHWLLGVNMSGVCLAEKMSWAAKRETTRVEDQAYCLLGIFGINMPLLYGEGHRAFGRLQKEIIGRSGDRSILLHTSWSRLLAESSQHFESQACVISIKQAGHILPYATTNVGLEFRDDLYYIPLDVGLESWRRPPDERNSQRLLNLNGRRLGVLRHWKKRSTVA